ncbi:DICT sensory domain-containing protein [Thermohalobacter berrensis]|uniref:Histidine kinase n=1 Tax=Thermohalobacter berrensis TaxID=99594 RepID=A0A419T6Z6_9FIRM|nr:DICT sensory domain-containing protein [Thermohalobacter berrensis]RKD33158.1 histidine kinase [Thermohalobacter berrensis]
MKRISLFKEIFDKVEGDVQKIEGKASDSVLSKNTIKYETKVRNLERMCYIMESMILKKKRNGIVYAGFQKLSRTEGVWDRFLKMAINVDKIYVFGVNDKKPQSHPNIEFINLPPNHPLVREWFLVIDVKFMRNMMVAYDKDGFGTKPLDTDRNFIGAKTVNLKHIDKAVKLLNEIIQ